jgi:hypothetical protein
MYEKNKQEFYSNLGGLNQKVSEYLTPDNQVLNLRNFCFERPGAWVSRPGTADFASLAGISYLANPAGLFEYIKNDGVSQVIFDCGPTLYYFSSPPTAISGSFTANVTTFYPTDFEVSGEYLFIANGYRHVRYDGSFAVQYGVPKASTLFASAGVTFNTGVNITSETYIIPSGDYFFRYALVKNSATISPGPIGERLPDDLQGANYGVSVNVAATVVSYGSWVLYGFTVPPGYGVSAILPFKAGPGNQTLYAGPDIVNFFLTTYAGTTLYTMQFPHFIDPTIRTETPEFTLVPRYLETYKNMFFMAGFSSALSTVYFSEIAEPENVSAENYFDVRPGNGDRITNMIPFQDALVIFKSKSTHVLTGFSPDTLALKDATLEYGCLNSTGAVAFENKLWFVDERGICEFNGPDTFIVSYEIEDALSSVDKTKCRALHVKERNEVWFCFGAVCFIYDYDVGAWTIFDNIAIEEQKGAGLFNFGPTTVAVAYAERGASFVQFTRFNESVFTDRGSAITLIAQTKYLTRSSQSTQEMWRRLYLDAEATSATVGVTVNFRGDYNTNVSLSRVMYLDDFQNRIDFGYSAKALSIEFVLRASEQITINGYTVESKYLRNT